MTPAPDGMSALGEATAIGVSVVVVWTGDQQRVRGDVVIQVVDTEPVKFAIEAGPITDILVKSATPVPVAVV